MLTSVIDWYSRQDKEIQSVVISSATTLVALVIAGSCKAVYEQFSLNYKMKREYYFTQKKKIKESLSVSKTPLIKSAEDLNDRLWNLSRNIGKQWHNLEEDDWTKHNNYYLKSFIYRLLVFIHWTLKAEDSVYNFDLKLADRDDAKYLKYLKTLKHFFCDSLLLEDLGYSGSHSKSHFFKNDLAKFANYIVEGGEVIDYEHFVKKFDSNYTPIRPVCLYINQIQDIATDLNYNAIKAFHLFLIIFINKYGLGYHKTNRKKLTKLIDEKYYDLAIKKSYYRFLRRNKVLRESRLIRRKLSLKKVPSDEY